MGVRRQRPLKVPSKTSITRRGNAVETVVETDVQSVNVVELVGSHGAVPALVALIGSTLRRASLSRPLYGTFFLAVAA